MIFIVSHKDYQFPNDEGYKPIQVGNKNIESIEIKDSTADNISSLNPSFCELTALYWIWKNNSDPIIGLMHYRRYFKYSKSSTLIGNKKIASSHDFNLYENNIDLVVHKPRNYFITSIKNHYNRAHHEKDFELLRKEIEIQYPAYLQAFDKVMSGSSISLYNMFVAKREKIEPYFIWLFNILFALEKKISYEEYDNHQKRVFGFMAERLFNVWLEYNKNNLKIEYRKVVNVEGENIFKKGLGLLRRHLIRK